MKLYHFCAPQFLAGIRREGLTLGRTPFLLAGRMGFIKGTQWMTVNPDFEQCWNGMVTIKYDRTAFRLTYTIPKDARERLVTWWQLKARMVKKLGPGCILADFDTCGDPENWRVYLGHVKAGWLRGVAAKEQAEIGPRGKEQS